MDEHDILDVVRGCTYTWAISVGTLGVGETVTSVTITIGEDTRTTPVMTKTAVVAGGTATFTFSNTDTGSLDPNVPVYYFSVKMVTNQRIVPLVQVARFCVNELV